MTIFVGDCMRSKARTGFVNKEKMMIRRAKQNDLTEILRVYDVAKKYMIESGNPNQWGKEYPPLDEFNRELAEGLIYVLERERPTDGQRSIYGVFELMDTPDPTYSYIEDGCWISEAPYGTIHRVASDGSEKNVLGTIVAFAREKYNHLRIDTHEQNLTMQHVIRKNGFEYCGIIYLKNGAARRAYEWVADNQK